MSKSSKKSLSLRDLLIFFGFAGVPIVSFWLQEYPSTPFYSSVLVIFLLVLIWMRQYHGEHEFRALVDYDENLHLDSFLWIILGVVGTYICSSFIVSRFTVSAIYVPVQGLDISYGNFQLSGIWNDILFQIVLVAPSEELCKLTLHLAFYMRLKGSFSNTLAKTVSIGVPIGFWALLHSYRAYVGPQAYTMLIAAFVGGIIIFAVMWKTSSLLAAILTHAGFNIVVIWAMQNLQNLPAALVLALERMVMLFG